MPLVVHFWADLQSVHGLRCYDNITRTRNVSEYMLVLALRLVLFVVTFFEDMKFLYITRVATDVKMDRWYSKRYIGVEGRWAWDDVFWGLVRSDP